MSVNMEQHRESPVLSLYLTYEQYKNEFTPKILKTYMSYSLILKKLSTL